MNINSTENKKNNSNNANNTNGINTKPNNFNNKFYKNRNKKQKHLNLNNNSNNNNPENKPENKPAVQQPPKSPVNTINTVNKSDIIEKIVKAEKSAVQSQNPKNFKNNKNKNFKPNKTHKDGKDNRNEKNDRPDRNERNETKQESGTDNNFLDYQISRTEEPEIDTDEIFDYKLPEPVEIGPTIEIVGVRYKPVGKIYFFSPNGTDYSPNDKVIVETSKGLELGYIAIPNKNISESKIVQPLKPVIRKASDDDAERSERNKKLAKDTIKIANDRIKFHNLDNMKMKLIEAEYTFDNSKLTYYFTADGRVDFRELVKDLAAIFKTRIEMRQIGIRDQTKILGGLSICGRPFCCNSFLQDFAQVTIKMAKEQNMSINSAKISGACGKLMCCLKYEHEVYDYLGKETPKVNSIVEISTGETGTVTESNLLTGICKVRVNQKNNGDNDNVIKSFPKKNLKIIGFMKNEQERKNNGDDKETEDLKELENGN